MQPGVAPRWQHRMPPVSPHWSVRTNQDWMHKGLLIAW